MRKPAERYFDSLRQMLGQVRVTRLSGRSLPFLDGLATVADHLRDRCAAGRKILFIGNGANAGICSHMATDWWKHGRMRAMAFNDPAGLTCIANDCGVEQIFAKPVEMFADPEDVLVAMSSSGKSSNILRAVKTARLRRAGVVTLSGFDAKNPLATLGDFNFYVPWSGYEIVEIVHHSILHCMLDIIVTSRAAKGAPKPKRSRKP